MNKKYEIFKESADDTLYRIRAVRDFGDVEIGDVGGFVEGEHNLSHDGNCWIYDIARVFGNALVYGNARVYGDARVFGNVQIYNEARIYGKTRVYGDAQISGNARVYGNARVHGDACIYGNTYVSDKAQIYGNASVFGGAVVGEQNRVFVGNLITDITNGRNKLDAIRCGVKDVTISGDGTEVICYKKVCSDLSSLHDHNFKYEVSKWVEEPNCDPDPAVSCGSGLHFAGPDYWDEGMILLECKVMIEDVIAVQQGKIRAKRAFVVRKVDW